MTRILEWERQFASVELCHKLFELKMQGDTCFLWIWNNEIHTPTGWSIFANSPYVQRNLSWEKMIPAYSVAELGEMLPYGVHAASSKDETGWYMQVISPIAKWKEMYPCQNEADARAKMLIHLIENKLMEVNK